MKEFVMKLGCTWQYVEMPSEKELKQCTESEEFDEFTLLNISDINYPEICLIRKEKKYGIYTFDQSIGENGCKTWCTPTQNPFPYDEVKYCVTPDIHDVGFLAFRISNKWGIIKVVARILDTTEGIYDVEYAGTKRRIVVPCQYVALEDAEIQLGESFKWEEPFLKNEVKSLTTPSIKRNVKKGTGRDKIRVTFPDGVIIEDSVVWKTLAETIKRLDVQRVEKLKIPGIEKRNILLVDTHPTDDTIYRRSQKEIAPGYYLLTYNNTPQKAIYLEQISELLHANLKIELISY